jgi:NitT/TauT family transport system ATP-binding protein
MTSNVELRPKDQLAALPVSTEEPSFLKVKELSVVFPNGNGGLTALSEVNFDLHRQEFLAVLGPSGSGKSTLLRTIAGLIEPSSGQVVFCGGEHERPRIGFVFQQANLMPWRSVLDNITLPLELENVPHAEAASQAQELIELVGLQGFEKNWPGELSGGMAQRVALARALIHDPDILLLDEPFGALDALTRDRMGNELLRIWQVRKKTVLLVTHSINEAVYLADRALVFTSRPGRICLDTTIHLPRPREEDMRYSCDFGEAAHQIRSAISEG